MITLTRYAMDNGTRHSESTQQLTLLAALGELTSFLAIDRNAAIHNEPTALEIWRDGPMGDQFGRFEGAEEDMRDIHKMWCMNNDDAMIATALTERLGAPLPKLLEMRTRVRGPSRRMLILLLLAGADDKDDFLHLPGRVSAASQLVTALELMQDERKHGRNTSLWDIMQPAQAA